MSVIENNTISFVDIVGMILANDVDQISRFFVQAGSADPHLIWDPRPGDVASVELKRLQSYWRSLPAIHGVPDYSAFDPADVRFVLGNLHVVEYRPDREALRYRLYGSVVAARYGRDQTDQWLPRDGRGLARYFTAAYLAVIANEKCVYACHSPPDGSAVRDCQRLVLPFRGDDGRIDRLLVAQLPYRLPLSSVARPA